METKIKPALSHFRELQGESFNQRPEALETLWKNQQKFIDRALKILRFYEGKAESKKAEVNTLIKDFKGYTQSFMSGEALNQPEEFHKIQHAFYDKIHTSSISEFKKLGFEILLGLVRFDIATQLILQFAKFCREQNIEAFKELPLTNFENEISQIKDPEKFLRRLEIASEISHKILACFGTSFIRPANEEDTYWEYVEKFYQKYPVLESLAKKLTSMQYIPENQSFISIAKTWHWRDGFGSDGRKLQEIPALKPLHMHAIGFHNSAEGNFTHRLKLCSKSIEASNEHMTDCVVALAKKLFPTSEKLRMYDFCSGPKIRGIVGVINNLAEAGYPIRLTVSDVDAASLQGLEKLRLEGKEKYKIKDVRYEDLSQDLKEHPKDKDRFHIVSVVLSMHQLSPQKITDSLRHFVSITKTGGIIANLDIANDVYFATFALPGNLVDREGAVPSISELNFASVSVPTIEGKVKFPYPLHKAHCHTPARLPKGTLHLNLYTVVELHEEQVKELQALWTNKNYEAADKFVETMAGRDISGMQRTVSQAKVRTC